MGFIIGKKMGMTQIWKEGEVVPVTMIKIPSNKVSLIRTKERDGYSAVQLSVGKMKKEFRLDDASNIEEGMPVSVSDFKEGDVVSIKGVSKGRGFQGTTKRYNFGGAPKTHGQKDKLRAPGSIGTAGAGRVWKGRKMPGRMGSDTIHIKNLKIAEVRPEENMILVKGALPGAPGGTIEIIRTKAAKVTAEVSAES